MKRITFADDNAHCEGEGCDKRDRCIRYLALMQKREARSGFHVCMASPNPIDCQLFLEIPDEHS